MSLETLNYVGLRARRETLDVCPFCGCFVRISQHTMDRCRRYQSIVQLRKTMTLDEIGRKFGISGERVRQILKRRPD